MSNDRLDGLSPAKRALLERLIAERKAAAEAVRPRPRPERVPLSYGQERLWVVDQLTPGTGAYNVPLALWLDGTLDAPALDAALQELVRRHEALRTTLPSEDGKPYQRITSESFALPIDVADVSNEADPREAAIARMRRTFRQPFDLARGPLVRALRVRVAEDRHLLLLVMHHIVVDGWSLGVLLRELIEIYNAFAAQQPSPLVTTPLQYADFALWQREWLDGHRLDAQLAYWTEHLAGCPTVIDLPSDRPRPAVQTFRGATARFVVPEELYKEVEQFSRRENVTPFMTFFAVYATLLHRYTGQSDLPIAMGIANRQRAELESIVGFFVNTLILRNDLGGDPTFRELLARVRDTTLGAQANQDAPASRVLEALRVERVTSHMPLMQAMFFFQNYPQDAASMRGLTIRRVALDELQPDTAQSELSLYVNQDSVGELLFQYSTDLFDGDTIARLAGHFITLLRGAVADASTPIGALPLLTGDERAQLAAWNDTRHDYPGDRPLVDLFVRQAARTPDAVALTFHGRDVTYRELQARVSDLARTLRARGIGRGDLVGLYVERSVEMLVGLLGILEAGAAYVPLDPGFPAERLAFMLADAAARVVVTQASLVERVPSASVEKIVVDASARIVGGDAIACDARPGDLAYVIFTSGSTGRPKGVQITQRSAVNLVTSVAREPGQRASDTICAVSTLSFDIAVFELFVPLTVGARILLVDSETQRDGAALARFIDANDITIMQATPATWRMLLDIGWSGKAGLKMITTGEACPRELAERLIPCCDELWNLYGPTETTVYSTLGPIVSGSGPISIGKPVANTQIHIVDRNFQPLPVGVPGELLIGGDGLARGYLGRPELTAEKFIADPFSDAPNARLYRSGDLATWRRDGTLEVLGRLDHQVKLRGFRIELGEIEAVLNDHASVDQAVVHCREDRPGDKRLVAYVTGDAPSPDALRAHLRTSLPDYMIPAAIVVLDRFPLTPNGKVNRHALPAPELAREHDAVELPQGAQEEQMAALWSQILGRERIGRNDNFFDLGGHSLLATQLLARVQAQYAVDIPLRALFEAPTVARLAIKVAEARDANLAGEQLDDLLAQLEGLSDEDATIAMKGL
ncbi:MAG: amino acid adenylation domain-containing protein [Acidobacteria bacterium]|nr:amino acid adenylation domain-containing protein [Acidobacteriota bacterium]MBV9475787.1 amino acid adenylation domain-containing protein [Acidobacteriota bacterium]